MTVIRGERDGKHITGVSNKSPGSGSSIEIPETERFIPGGRQSELTIAGNNDILDKMIVTGQSATGHTVVGLIAGKRPDEQGLVARRRDDHRWILGGGCDGSDPVGVADKRSAVDKRFHGVEKKSHADHRLGWLNPQP